MASPLTRLSAVRKQNLLVEFSSLKAASPQGVLVSLTPGDPALWSGVIFVRKGPYSPAVLRFQISFPPLYPEFPPLITFSTEMFHPLVTPLTTYMYSTDVHDSGTVSATDEERLPPGGFSLRDGFPGWFGRTSRRSAEERIKQVQTPTKLDSSEGPVSVTSHSQFGSGSTATPGSQTMGQRRVSIFEVLRYIRNTFDNEEVLDKIPLEAAGNPNAWHAWRTHRIACGKIPPQENSSVASKALDSSEESKNLLDAQREPSADIHGTLAAKKPGEWNWDGVWEVRVNRAIESSLSEGVLFGNLAGDDMIRFSKLEEEEIRTIKENMIRAGQMVDPPRRNVSMVNL